MSLPLALKKSFKNGKLIPLVGAGVSMSLSDKNGAQIFPSWPKALEMASEELTKQNKKDFADGVRAMVNLGMFQQAASIAKKGLVGGLWSEYLRSCFNVSRSMLDDASLALPREVWKLSDRIITLNFDQVLEYASPIPDDVHSIDNSHKNELLEFSRGKLARPAIWHLHGNIRNVGSIVFSEDEYKELYESDENYQAALVTLSAVFSQSNLLFIGCSLSDAELLQKINGVHKIFNESTGPHYALVRKSEVKLVKEKLGTLPVEVVEFEDFGVPLIKKIQEIYTDDLSSIDKIEPVRENSDSDIVKAAILTADPIDRPFNNTEILKEIQKLRCDLTSLPLNLVALNSLEGFDYVFIVATLVKGKIVIEDDYLSSYRIGIRELLENIGQSNLLGVFLLFDNDDIGQISEAELDASRLPVILIHQLDKDKLRSFAFQIFRKKNLKFFSNSFIGGEKGFVLKELQGKTVIRSIRTPLPETIDPKSVKGFIGRVTDLQTLTKRILDLGSDGSFLTLKGSGGIGKTTTLKKVVVEMAARNLFSDGIEFVDCEFIREYRIFEQNVARAFNLELAVDLKRQIKENLGKQNMLIVLDNFETVLHTPDCRDIVELISFLSDYVVIVVTSRELLRADDEQYYELRQLTTDEGLALFLAGLSSKVKDASDEKFIREKIVEDLLDNNPLAIKLVTKSVPKGVNFYALAAELEQDFFNRVTDEDMLAFDSPSDVNVERKRSLYASINFSYLNLNDKEKIAFELLSLFPDGINIERFKQVCAGTSLNRRDNKESNNPVNQFIITDALIRSLESKSVIQISNQGVMLQSLLGRFSEKKFNTRSAEEIARFHKNAFIYNANFASALVKYKAINPGLSIKAFNSYQKNFLKCVDYIFCESVPVQSACGFIRDATNLFIELCAPRSLYNALMQHEELGEDLFYERLYVEAKKLQLRYFDGEFDQAYSDLKKILPLDDILEMPLDNELARSVATSASNIYSMEGHVLETLLIDSKYAHGAPDYPDSLFLLGEFDQELAQLSRRALHTLETLLALGKLSLAQLDEYIDELYEKQRIDLVQYNYIRVKLVGRPKHKLQKLVVANPYTAGLKSLMYALLEENSQKKIKYFQDSLPNLFHIKYYYAEALLFFSEHLNNVVSPDFENVWKEGFDLACACNFRYLIYKFEKVKGKVGDFDSKDYPLPQTQNWAEHISIVKRKSLALSRNE